MRKNQTLLAMTASAAAFIVLVGFAMARAAAAGALTSAGRQLMDQASQANIAEMEEGRLALTHSGNPQVQALGNRLVQDHSRAEQALEALAGKMGVKLPTRPSAKQQLEIARLGGLEGAAFDRSFAASEVAGHRKTITEMDHAAATVRSPALEAWVKESIPVLQEHLQLARGLPSQVAITRAAQAAAATPR